MKLTFCVYDVFLIYQNHKENMEQDRIIQEGRIFEPYYTQLLIEAFEKHTGYKVSSLQQIKLSVFLSKWTKENLESVLEA